MRVAYGVPLCRPIYALPERRVNGDAVGFSWVFYRRLKKRSHPGELSRHRTFPSVQRPPRRRTSDVTTVRPPSPTLSPFTGLLTGGDGPRSAIARACPVP